MARDPDKLTPEVSAEELAKKLKAKENPLAPEQDDTNAEKGAFGWQSSIPEDSSPQGADEIEYHPLEGETGSTVHVTAEGEKRPAETEGAASKAQVSGIADGSSSQATNSEYRGQQETTSAPAHQAGSSGYTGLSTPGSPTQAHHAGPDLAAVQNGAPLGAGAHGGGGDGGTAAPPPLRVGGDLAGDVIEDGQLVASGKLSASGGESGAKLWTLANDRGHYGTITLDPAGHWRYQLDNANPTVQALGAGQHLSENFMAFVTDPATGQVQIAHIAIKVDGTNDAAVISGTDSGTTTEDLVSQCTGQLQITDIDQGEASFRAGDIAGTYGTLHLASDGRWTYDLDSATVQDLGVGKTATETLTVSAADGTTHTVTVVIGGTNDAPAMTILAPIAADEGDAVLGGKLAATDVDTGDTLSFSVASPVAGFTLSANGQYSFDPSDPAYDYLQAGQRLYLDIPVTVADGQGGQDTQHLHITLTGTNDVPALQATPQSVDEDGAVVQGRLVGTDADTGDLLAYAASQQVPGLALSIDGSYRFDPSNSAYQHLYAGEQLVLHIPVSVTDASGARDTQMLQITVTGTNDLPIMQMTPPMATFEGTPLMQGHLTAIDVDDHETLTFQSPTPVAGFAIAADGSWTFDPSDPAYDHLAFGQQQTVTVPVEVVDSTGGVTASQIQITLTGTNDAPTLSITPPRVVDENASSIQGQLTATDPDDGDTLTFSVGQHVPGFTLNADGSYTFDPADPNYNYLSAGQKSVVTVPIFVTDGHGATDTQQVQITVTGTNDVPVFGGIDHAMGAIANATGGRLRISSHLVVLDLDQGESHFQSQVLSGTYGVLEIKSDGSWTYTADTTNPVLASLPANGHLPDHFTVRSADGTTHDIDIQIKGANNPAIFAGTSAGMIAEDQTGSISHHLSVTDPNAGESAFIPIDRATPYGHFTLTASGDWSYMLDNANPAVQALVHGKTLTDSITVGSVDGTPTVITVTIMGADDRAIISGMHTGNITEDNIGTGTTLTASGQLSVLDPDAGQEHFVAMANIAGDHGFGSFSIDENGHWTYSADNSQSAIQTLPHGQTATDSVTFMTADGTQQTITVTITGSNDGPQVFAAVTLPAGTEDTDVTLTSAQLLAHATDVDQGETAQLSVHNLVSDHGTITDNGDGTFTFHPEKDYNGPVSFTYDVQDPQGASVPATATIDLAAVGDAAIIGGQDTGSIIEDHVVGGGSVGFSLQARGTLTIQDPDAGEAVFEERLPSMQRYVADNTVQGTYGTLQIGADGYWIYQADNHNPKIQALRDNQVVTDTITVRSADGTTHDIVITITGTNDGAIVSGTSMATVTEDTGVTGGQLTTSGDLSVVDVDDGEQHFVAQQSVTGSNGYGAFSIDENGHWTYTADNSQKAIQDLDTRQHLTDTITVSTADGTTKTITVTIEGQDDHVTIAGDTTGAVTEDSTADGSFLGRMTTSGGSMANGGDFGDHVIAGQYGSFDIRNDGRWIYTLDNTKAAVQALADGETAEDKITVTTRDGATQELVVTVTGTHDLPSVTVHGATPDHSISSIVQIDNPTGALDLSAFDAQHVGTTTGVRMLALYAPGSDVNVLASIPEAQRPTLTTDYSSAGVSGYQRFATHGWFGQNLNIPGYDFNPVAPSVRNTWDGGIAVFSDGTVALVQKVCDGFGSSEKDYIYLSKYTSLNANQGGSIISGLAPAGSTVVLFEGSTQVGTATADANGHWELGISQLGDGTHTLHTVINGQPQPDHIFSVAGDAATEVPGSLLLGMATEDTTIAPLTGELDIADVDSSDAPHFVAQPATAGTYGTFSIDAQGHWIYTLNNGAAATQALDPNQRETETFRVEVTTNSGETIFRDVTVQITGTNDAPVVTATDAASAADLGATDEDTSKTFTEAELLQFVGASDRDGDTLSVSAVTIDPAFGSFTSDGHGRWTFTPVANVSRDDIEITITVSDGHTTTPATALLDITAVADTPVSSMAESVHTDFTNDAAHQYSGTHGFVDPTQWGWQTDNSDGLVEQGQGSVYGDTSGGNLGIVELEGKANEPSNLYRVIQTQAGAAYHLEFDLSGRVGASSDSAAVQVIWEGQVIDTLRPAGNAFGFVHHAYDLVATGDSSKIELRAVTQDGSGPIIDNLDLAFTGLSGVEDTDLPINLNLQLADTDGSEVQSVGFEGLPVGFSVTDGVHTATVQTVGEKIVTDGWDMEHLKIQPAANFNGDVNIVVSASSVEQSNHDTASVDYPIRLHFAAVNDAPTASAAAMAIDEDTSHAFSAADFGFADVDTGAALAHVTILSLPTTTQGQLLLNGQAVAANQQIAAADIPHLVFQPATDFNGNVAFRYAVSDGSAESAPVSGTLVVRSVDDPSVISGTDHASVTEGGGVTSHPDLTVSKGAWIANGVPANTLPEVTMGDPDTGRWYTTGGLARDLHIAGQTDTLHFPSGFWLMNMGNPNYGFHGWQLFPNGGTSATAQYTAIPVDAAGDLHIQDVDSPTPSFIDVDNQLGDNGYGTFTMHGGHWTFVTNDKAEALPDGVSATETITFRATDGTSHTVTIHITGSDTASRIEGDFGASIDESRTGAEVQARGTLTIVDPDTGQDPTLPDFTDRAGDSGFGHFSMQGGHWTYVLDPAASDRMSEGVLFHDQITIRASDGREQTIVIEITGTNDAPTITATAITTAEDATHTFSVADFGFVDVDANSRLSAVTITQLPDHTHGFFQLNGQLVAVGDAISAADIPKLVFQPAANFNGDVSFSYRVSDGVSSSAETSGTLTVTAVNDAPVVTAVSTSPVDMGATPEDTPKSFSEADLLRMVGASDVDAGDTLSVSDVSVDPAVGAFARQTDGSWTFTPAANFKGDDIDVTIKVSDGTAETEAHGTLDISPVTDAPTPSLTVMAQQQVMEFASGSASGVVNSDTINACGAMHGITVDMTILGGQQVTSTAGHGATFISYATPSDSNAMYIWKPEDLTFRIGGHEYTTGVALLNDGHDHRYTFSWNGDQGTLDVLIDGRLVAHLDNIGTGATLADGGKFALGNDQDNFGGGFSAGDAFTGQIFNAAVAKTATDPDALAKTSLANLLDGDPNLLTDIQVKNGQFVDGTGNHHYAAVGAVTVSTVEVDTSVASPNPGATLKLALDAGAPADTSDTVSAQRVFGFPAGTVVSDGHGHTVTVADPGTLIDLSGWEMDGLQAQLPPAYHGNMNIGYAVTTTGPDGSSETAVDHSPVILDPTQPVPDAAIQGDDAEVTDEDTAVSGHLSITDTDAGESHFVAQADTDGQYGHFSLTDDGQWTYTPDDRADALADGAKATETFSVASADGSHHIVSIDLLGTDDGLSVQQPPAASADEPDLGSPVDDYMLYADTSSTGSSGVSDSNSADTGSSLDDYLAAAGVDAHDLAAATPSDPPPDVHAADAVDAPAQDDTHDDPLVDDVPVDVPDVLIEDDPQHHDV